MSAHASARLRTAAILAAGIALYLVLAISSMRGQSATFDEGAHLPAGYSYLSQGDHRLNPEHPPLLKVIAAAPLLLLHPRFDTQDEAWALRRQWELGRRFLYRWNDGDRLLFWGRMPIVLLGAALCLAVYAWTRRHWGEGAARLAFGLTVLSPEVLAHGQLVTTDLGVSLFLFVSVIAYERLLERVTPGRTVLCGLAVGAALASKFSALVLGPILLGLLAITLWLRRGGTLAPKDATATGADLPVAQRGPRAAALFGATLATGVLALAVVWASYGFERRLSPDPAVAAAFEWSRVTPQQGPLAAATSVTRRLGLLPDAYVFGFLRFFRHSEARPSFLMGRLSAEGFAWFFPATFLFKTPLALILLLLLFAATWRRHGTPALAEWCLWLPVLVYVVVTETRGLNIGHRHLLPLHPFLFVAAGRTVVWAMAHTHRRHAMTLVAALALWYAGSSLRAYPHYLAHFNELAGGPAGGHRYLVDSSLDWGQDLKGLARLVKDRGIPRIKLSYFGSADPEYYGIPADLLPSQMLPPPTRVMRRVEPGDVVAISATNLQGVYLDPAMQPFLADLRSRKPLAAVGHSIFLYRMDRAWDLP